MTEYPPERQRDSKSIKEKVWVISIMLKSRVSGALMMCSKGPSVNSRTWHMGKFSVSIFKIELIKFNECNTNPFLLHGII